MQKRPNGMMVDGHDGHSLATMILRALVTNRWILLYVKLKFFKMLRKVKS